MNSEYNKAFVALITTVLIVIDQVWSLSIGPLDERWLTIIFAILAPILVWAVPNTKTQTKR